MDHRDWSRPLQMLNRSQNAFLGDTPQTTQPDSSTAFDTSSAADLNLKNTLPTHHGMLQPSHSNPGMFVFNGGHRDIPQDTSHHVLFGSVATLQDNSLNPFPDMHFMQPANHLPSLGNIGSMVQTTLGIDVEAPEGVANYPYTAPLGTLETVATQNDAGNFQTPHGPLDAPLVPFPDMTIGAYHPTRASLGMNEALDSSQLAPGYWLVDMNNTTTSHSDLDSPPLPFTHPHMSAGAYDSSRASTVGFSNSSPSTLGPGPVDMNDAASNHTVALNQFQEMGTRGTSWGASVGRKRARTPEHMVTPDPQKKIPQTADTGVEMRSTSISKKPEGIKEMMSKFEVAGRRVKTKSPLSIEEKKSISSKRGKVCQKCRKGKIKYEPSNSIYIPCAYCLTYTPRRGLPKTPCFQSDMNEARLFRLRPPATGGVLSQRRGNIYDLADISDDSEDFISLQLKQGVPHLLTVDVECFSPKDGDRTAYVWTTNGVPHRMEMPKYCLANLEKATQSMVDYFKEAKYSYLLRLKDEPGPQSLLWNSIAMAVKYAHHNPGSMVENAIDLWSGSRMIEVSWTISGEETLGIGVISDRSNPWNGTVPITPIMDTQLDQIVIKRILLPLQTRLLSRIDQTLNSYRPQRWMELFLTMIVLLCSIEANTKHQNKFATRYGMGRRFPKTPVVEMLCHSAKIFLSRFHYTCGGATFFNSQSFEAKDRRHLKFSTEEINYLKYLRNKTKENERDMRQLRLHNKYESPLYWVHQLWFDNWHPGRPFSDDEAEGDYFQAMNEDDT